VLFKPFLICTSFPSLSYVALCQSGSTFDETYFTPEVHVLSSLCLKQPIRWNYLQFSQQRFGKLNRKVWPQYVWCPLSRKRPEIATWWRPCLLTYSQRYDNTVVGECFVSFQTTLLEDKSGGSSAWQSLQSLGRMWYQRRPNIKLFCYAYYHLEGCIEHTEDIFLWTNRISEI